jgi:hypothetical protein
MPSMTRWVISHNLLVIAFWPIVTDAGFAFVSRASGAPSQQNSGSTGGHSRERHSEISLPFTSDSGAGGCATVVAVAQWQYSSLLHSQCDVAEQAAPGRPAMRQAAQGGQL